MNIFTLSNALSAAVLAQQVDSPPAPSQEAPIGELDFSRLIAFRTERLRYRSLMLSGLDLDHSRDENATAIESLTKYIQNASVEEVEIDAPVIISKLVKLLAHGTGNTWQEVGTTKKVNVHDLMLAIGNKVPITTIRELARQFERASIDGIAADLLAGSMALREIQLIIQDFAYSPDPTKRALACRMGTDPAVDFAQMKKLADKSRVFWYDFDHKKGFRSNRVGIVKEIGELADNIIGLLKRAECID